MTTRRFLSVLLMASLAGSTTAMALTWQAAPQVGFQDTPMLPGNRWHVHDGTRPQPPVVTPGTFSTPESSGKAPSDAIVLFDGHDLAHWRTETGLESGWKVDDGLLIVPPKGTRAGGTIYSKDKFGDCQIHLEFATPTPPSGSSQGRGNSGLLIMGRYEVQILDAFENPTYADGTVSAVYGQTPPLVNAAKPPGEWQTLDVAFTAPRFEPDGSVASPAIVTVFLNGVLTQNHVASLGTMAYRQVAKYQAHEPRESLALQDHSNPVRFRNIWVREIKSVEQP